MNQNMLQRVIGVLLLIALATVAQAQTGTIKGTVKDATTGESIVGANIIVAGTTQGVQADLDGNFQISKVKAGSYNVIVSFISYKTDTLKNVTVYPDQVTVINTALRDQSKELAEVVITGARVINTDISVITEMKNADLVAVGISSQQITMSQDRDAAQILKRIPGVTIFNNRFVNVRGLSERYSTVMLNGVMAPSTEVDSRAFAFDLIPSNMIDRMLVYKSGAAELPGEFAGAVININTKSIVEENSLSINVTGSFRNGTTFNDFGTYEGSPTDVLGFDNGKRALPSLFPAVNLRNYSQDLSSPGNVAMLKSAGSMLQNQYSPVTEQAMPDLRTTINFSRSVNFGNDMKLSNVTSVSYANTYQAFDQTNRYYNQGTGALRYNFHDQRYAHTSRSGIISNFIFEFNPSNKIEFSNLLNQQGTSQVTTRQGTEDLVGIDVDNISLNYWERSLYSGQLQGKHGLSDAINLNWIFGYSTINSDQPDYRRFRRQRPTGQGNEFQLVVPPTASAFDGRFFSELSEKVYTHAINLEIKLNPNEELEEKQAKILTGYYLAQTDRSFDARWFSYRWFNNTDNSILSQPLEQIFSQQNIAPAEQPLFVLEEGTNFSDSYTGENRLMAGYASITVPFSKFRLATGARVEDNRQQLNSFETTGEPLNVDNPVTSVLPFANLSYNLSEKVLFRLAYSKTVNRPVFREIALFNYYDFDRNANFYGNPTLRVARVDNIDFRWEVYPSKGENFTLGLFYKNFVDPIELLNVGGTNLLYTFGNAKSATSYGVEFEARKSLKDLTASPFINNLSVNLNAAFIASEVKFDLNDPLYVNQESGRYMQGQSPYLVNTGIYYNDYDRGWQVNVSYNVFGPRIYSAGDSDENPTQYELPRHQFDLTVAKELGRSWEVKFGLQDLLNNSYRINQDQDRDQKITDADQPILDYRPGQYVSLGVTYTIKRN